MHLDCFASSSYEDFQQINYPPLFGVNVTPHSTYPITLTVNTPNMAYNGPVGLLISYYTTPNSNFFNPNGCGPPHPTGIASYGTYGNEQANNISSNEIVGYMYLSSISASSMQLNSSANIIEFLPQVDVTDVQQNLVINVSDSDGSKKAYWLQNIYNLNLWPLPFQPSANFDYSFSNLSNYNSNLCDTSITGNGTLLEPCNQSPSFYVMSTNSIENGATLPIKIGFYARVDVEPDLGFTVNTGYKTSYDANVVWYGQFLVNDPQIQKASFYVSPSFTPSPHDAELVFTGVGGLEPYIVYTGMNASLGLFYYNETTNAFQSFPSLYTFGGSTGEDIFNLNVSMENGYAHVTTGAPYYGPLSNNLNMPFPNFLNDN